MGSELPVAKINGKNIFYMECFYEITSKLTNLKLPLCDKTLKVINQ